MHRLLALLVYILLTNPIQAQNSFSFNCTKDITIPCASKCITLSTTIPDIYSSSKTYIVNKTDCFKSIVDPATPGSSTNIKGDDIYSPVLNITFPFSFFGSSYSEVTASTNGYLSFDISIANTFSDFGILNRGDSLTTNLGTPQNLPSILYGRALIMGPYHDLDVKKSLPTTQIKYDVVGIAPYRKWIISYYNVPLYTTTCLNQNTNTHQIVLYETFGIVEVFIYDKEICMNWNDGKAMIGMQDFNRSSAIMAPGRAASSAPWGSMGMNEGWRFVPAAGNSLFKRAELYNISGTMISNGVASKIGNNQLNVDFVNICPPNSGASYIVKSFYNNPDGSATEIISIDTINVSKGEPVEVSVRNTDCSGNNGIIYINQPVGPDYEYSLDGIIWQSSNTFKVSKGIYKVIARSVTTGCTTTRKDIKVDLNNLDASISTNISSCPGEILSATITVSPVNGNAPYLFSLNGGSFQTSNVFTNVPAGNYKLEVTDAGGCIFITYISISSANSASAQITNATCGKPGDGSITVYPGFGSPPYSYSINGGPFQSSNIFNKLTAGSYSLYINDGNSCSYNFTVTVPGNVFFAAKVDIIKPDCLGNANGSLVVHPSLGQAPYTFALNSTNFQSDSTFTNLAAGNYNLQIKDASGCIKDTMINEVQPSLFKISALTTTSSTCLSTDGEIFIKANGGTTPYQYSIDSGKTFYLSHVFNSNAGIHPIIVKDANGCITKDTAIVNAINKTIKVDVGSDTTICFGSSLKLNANTSLPADFFTWSPSLGLSDSTSKSITATPPDTITYIVTAKSTVCEGSDTITVNILRKPIVNAGVDTTICYNSQATLYGKASNLSGPVKYLWLPSNEVADPTSPITKVSPRNTRINKYQLQVTDMYGCNFKVYDDVSVTMKPKVVAFAGNNGVASFNIPYQLSGSGGVDYLWSPSGVLDTATLQNPMATLQSDTRFNLVVKDDLGCMDSSAVLVKVYKGITYYVPNAFTPNGDGLNDTFKAIAPGIQQTNYFRIFNRWGKLMFQTSDVNKGWDGKFQNIHQPTGVYVWIIKGVDVNGKVLEIKGTTTLIR